MYCEINASRVLHTRDMMIYGQFIERFHRQIYPGIYDPGNSLSDEDGFRQDVMGDEVVDLWARQIPSFTAQTKDGRSLQVETLDVVATRHSASGLLALGAVNKHPREAQRLELRPDRPGGNIRTFVLAGRGPDAYNDIGITGARIEERDIQAPGPEGTICFELPAHSVCIIQIGK